MVGILVVFELMLTRTSVVIKSNLNEVLVENLFRLDKITLRHRPFLPLRLHVETLLLVVVASLLW